MINELRTYRLFAVDTKLPSGRLYTTDIVEKAIAACKKPFYVVYDINSYDIKKNQVDPEAICGFTDRMWVEKGFLWVRFRPYNTFVVPDIYERDPNSLSILPIAVGSFGDTAKLDVQALKLFAIAISKTNNNQFSKFVSKSRIMQDPFIGVTK